MPSILETFTLLFETDAEDVTRGAEDALDAVDNLEDQINRTDDSTTQLGESFLGLVESAQGAIVSLVGFGAITAGILNAAQYADDIGKFSQRIGANIEDVNAWSEAVIRSGGSATGLQSSVESLTNQLTDFVLTGGGEAAEVFARLGISAFDATGQVRSAFDLLPELAESFENLTSAEAVGFGQKLGLDQGTILLLQSGRREVDALVRKQRELGTITQEDADIAAAFNDAWADTRQVFNRLFTTIGNFILPILGEVLGSIQKFVQFLQENKTLVTGFFIGAGAAITAFYLPAVIRAAIATIAAIAPFIAIAAAIAAAGFAFALIYEDIQAFIAGNNSLIGLFVEKYPLIGDAIDAVSQAFKFLGATAQEIFAAIKDLPNDFTGSLQRIATAIIDMWKTIGALALGVVQDIASYFADLIPQAVDAATELVKSGFAEAGEFILGVFNRILEAIKAIFADVGAGLKAAIPDIGGILDSAKGFFGFGDAPDGTNSVEIGKRELDAAANNPLSGQTGASIQTNQTSTANRTTHVSVGRVAVDARGGDSQEIAGNIGSALSDQMKLAIADFDDGVAA